MKRLLILTTLMFLTLTKVSFGQDVANKNPIDQALLIEDYDFMLKTLEETHPNLYAYIPKDEFVKRTDELRESISKPMSKPEFYKILYKTIALIKQGHTMVFGDAGFGKFKNEGGLSFPFKILYFSDHIYIDQNYSLY